MLTIKWIFKEHILFWIWKLTVQTVFLSCAVVLDVVLNFKAYTNMNKLRLFLKLVVAVAWVIALPICYLHSWETESGILKVIKRWLNQTGKIQIPSLYITAVIIYLLPNVLGAVLFLLPFLRRWIENSNWRIFQILLWWSQVRLLRTFYKRLECEPWRTI